ncbi:Protein lin-54-like protein [Trichoplax sp. H2]|nr:Protein lin-54-like protein [Trichoplax sp. H2]|eukprot:RDD47295.1 Protein lin-54-like protein [Trichoplax sp. H2]
MLEVMANTDHNIISHIEIKMTDDVTETQAITSPVMATQEDDSGISEKSKILSNVKTEINITAANASKTKVPATVSTEREPGNSLSTGQHRPRLLMPAGVPTQLGQIITKDGVVQIVVQQQCFNQHPSISSGKSFSLTAIPVSAGTVTLSSEAIPNKTAPFQDQKNYQRKPCNCSKSLCLKLYCECFANGEFCKNCNCTNCHNNIEHENERSRAIKACLERNPHAFRPKIGKAKEGNERRHSKGCNCKRSGCLKNYCECYEAKIPCTVLCKCTNCKNREDCLERKNLMQLADAADIRVKQQTAAKSKLSTQIDDLSASISAKNDGSRLPLNFISAEVIKATCNCLLKQAQESEKLNRVSSIAEKTILEEFGQCLRKIIQTANRTKGHSCGKYLSNIVQRMPQPEIIIIINRSYFSTGAFYYIDHIMFRFMIIHTAYTIALNVFDLNIKDSIICHFAKLRQARP